MRLSTASKLSGEGDFEVWRRARFSSSEHQHCLEFVMVFSCYYEWIHKFEDHLSFWSGSLCFCEIAAVMPFSKKLVDPSNFGCFVVLSSRNCRNAWIPAREFFFLSKDADFALFPGRRITKHQIYLPSKQLKIQSILSRQLTANSRQYLRSRNRWGESCNLPVSCPGNEWVTAPERTPAGPSSLSALVRLSAWRRSGAQREFDSAKGLSPAPHWSAHTREEIPCLEKKQHERIRDKVPWLQAIN